MEKIIPRILREGIVEHTQRDTTYPEMVQVCLEVTMTSENQCKYIARKGPPLCDRLPNIGLKLIINLVGDGQIPFLLPLGDSSRINFFE